jgi:hypothetical protein
MTKLVGVWILVALAACACTAQYQMTKSFDTWDAACAAVKEEYGENLCRGLDRPQVVQTQLLQILGALGVFVHNEYYVFVGNEAYLTLNGVTYDEVVFHETVHYILWHSEAERERCASEGMARKLTAEQFDIPESPTWRIQYGCTAPPGLGGMGI